MTARTAGEPAANGGARVRRVPILMYHEVTPEPHPAFRKYTVTPRTFAAHMSWLAAAGYVPVDLDALLAAREGRAPLPRRPVVITFDDGLRDCVEHAVPILQARGFTAVFYLVAGLVGRRSEWLLPECGIELPMADWAAVRGLAAAGFQCGAHTMTHPRLPRVPEARCRQELFDARRVLEDRLGREIVHLAYPFGAYDERVRALAAEGGYRTACSTRHGVSPANDDLLSLHRVTILGWDSLADFVCRLHTAAPVGAFVRRTIAGAVRRVRPGRLPAVS